MGKGFRPPRRRDGRNWRELRRLAEHGFRFHRACQHAWIRYVRRSSTENRWAEAVIAHCSCQSHPPGKVLLRAIGERRAPR